MYNLALAVEASVPCQEVDIVSTGVESLAVAALLSSRGRAVRFAQEVTPPEQLLIRGDNISYKAGRLSFNGGSEPDLMYRSSDMLLACGNAGDYKKALHMVAEMLRPGQTVFVVDAPLGTTFELSCLVFKLRKRMAVNIIEMGPLFDSCKFEGRSLEIYGLKDQVAICGRSVNETRSGLDIGRQLFNGLVPASNILERGLSDVSSVLQIALRLFYINRAKAGLAFNMLSSEQEKLIAGLESELQAIGKVYKVTIPERGSLNLEFSDHLEHEKQRLYAALTDTLVLLYELAAVAYLSVPVIESLIDQSSELLGLDIRANARRLVDLGLSNMDVREIIELINS